MIEDVKQDAEKRMHKSLESLETAFAKVRTGRAHPSILDSIYIQYYGENTPLKQVAQIGIEDGRTLTIKPFDRSSTPTIEKAILASDLGLNPSTAGDLIRLPMPPLTEETRRNLIKIVRQEAEGARVAVRNIRRDAISDLKELLKEKEISEDDDRKGQEQIQKLTDNIINNIAKLLEKKEKDLMEI